MKDVEWLIAELRKICEHWRSKSREQEGHYFNDCDSIDSIVEDIRDAIKRCDATDSTGPQVTPVDDGVFTPNALAGFTPEQQAALRKFMR